MVRVCVPIAHETRICEFSLISVRGTKAAPFVHSHTRKYIVRHTERNRLSFLPRALAVGGSMARHCILHAILIAKFLVQTPQPPIIIPPANMG